MNESIGDREAIRARGMAAHAPFGTWLLEDEPDAVCIRHLHGRKFMTDTQRAARGFPLAGRGVRSLGAMQTQAQAQAQTTTRGQ